MLKIKPNHHVHTQATFAIMDLKYENDSVTVSVTHKVRSVWTRKYPLVPCMLDVMCDMKVIINLKPLPFGHLWLVRLCERPLSHVDNITVLKRFVETKGSQPCVISTVKTLSYRPIATAIFTDRQRSCGKVMFSEVFVCPQWGGGEGITDTRSFQEGRVSRYPGGGDIPYPTLPLLWCYWGLLQQSVRILLEYFLVLCATNAVMGCVEFSASIHMVR